MPENARIIPLTESAVTVDFGNEISVELNERAIALAASLTRLPFRGLIEAVPAYSSVSVFFDLLEIKRRFPELPSAFDAVRQQIITALADVKSSPTPRTKAIELHVDFGDDVALDLNAIAVRVGLSKADVIDLFTARTYRVFMLGFLPGFAYLGEVDERISVPRHDSPRLRVPKGSVGIAGRQTGVYPLESPGGWQIIGRADVEMFTPDASSMCRLSAGDEVRFVPR